MDKKGEYEYAKGDIGTRPPIYPSPTPPSLTYHVSFSSKYKGTESIIYEIIVEASMIKNSPFLF